jgi:hypothetical protein
MKFVLLVVIVINFWRVFGNMKENKINKNKNKDERGKGTGTRRGGDGVGDVGTVRKALGISFRYVTLY